MKNPAKTTDDSKVVVEASELSEEVLATEANKPLESPVQEVTAAEPRITMSYSEYASSLSGSSALLFAALRLSHTSKRLTADEWANELNIFSTQEV